MQPGFPRTVIVYGVGLIGGSLALAIRRHFPDIRVFGVDNPDTLHRARSLGMIEPDDAVISDLVILATPVTQILQLLDTFPPNGRLILDVGSTKLDICRKAEKRSLAFIGGHPMTGTERSGPDAASADLFSGAPFFLCSVKSTPDGAVETISSFLSTIGANPSVVSPDEHDRIVARISHLPQLLSTVLADRAAGYLQYAGPGVKSMTRLAGSSFHVWRDIFETSGPLPQELHAFIGQLRAVLDALEAGDLAAIEAIFERANRSSLGGPH